MKRILLSILLLCGFIADAQIVDIPDPVFKAYLTNPWIEIDLDGDGEIQESEAEAIDQLILYYSFSTGGITDLTGIEAFTNLSFLILDSFSELEEIDLSGNTVLGHLELNGTGVVSLDLSDRITPLDLFLYSNPDLVSFDVGNTVISESIIDGNYNLTEANFAGASINWIALNSNNFLALDFSTTTFTDYPLYGHLSFDNNSNLSYINLSGGFNGDFGYSPGTGIVGVPNLEVICVDVLGGDIETELSAALSPSVQFTIDCIEPNVYTGVVKFDLNGDGCDLGDLSLSGVMVQSENGSITKLVAPDENGFYEMNLYVNDPDYTTSLVGLPDYFSVSPAAVPFDFVGFGNTEVLDFCIEATEEVNDVNVSLVSIIQANPGFTAKYAIVYKNMGTTASSGEMTLTYNDEKVFFSGATETVLSETDNSLTFAYADLLPLETSVIHVDFDTFIPPITEIGDELIYTAVISPDEIDETPEDNEFELTEEVISSFDPNDITVMEGAEVLIEDADDYLHYRIRFQNTGTAPAVTVRVENVLDDNLDWDTFELLTTSHTVELEIENDNDIEFIFNDINLIDSLTDADNSHGHIIYRIKPKLDIVVGDIIENQAAIYFDFNEPVITNIATTEITEPVIIAPDMNVSFVSTIQARPDFMASYALVYKNIGEVASSGEVMVTFDDEKINFNNASETVSNATGNSLTFAYSNILPTETGTIDINFNAFASPITEVGDEISFTVVISPDVNDEAPEDNEFVHEEEVVATYQPNDFAVMEGAEVSIEDIDAFLHYRIRFQNTGETSVATVRVENQLDDKLDWSTFELLTTSHTAEFEIENDNEIEFTFNDINLIDSSTDNDNSYGYIVYKIKPKSNIAIGDIIENQGAIYYDLDEALLTNTAITEIIDPDIILPPVSVGELHLLEYSVYPVPVSKELNIKSNTEIVKIELINELGQLLISTKGRNRLDVSTLSTGFYFIKVVDVYGNTGIQKITKY